MRNKLTLIAAIIMRVAIVVMLVYVALWFTKASTMNLKQYKEAEEYQKEEAMIALRELSEIGNGMPVYAGAMVVALICSIVSFRETSVGSSVVRTAFFACGSYLVIRSAIIFAALRNIPDTYSEEYVEMLRKTVGFGGAICLYGTAFISMFVLPVFIFTSIFAIFKLYRSRTTVTYAENGHWDV